MSGDTDTDILVVGGGVVGCATLFRLANLGFRCVLIEKNADLVSGASCGNSGMLHTGFDAPAGSLELSCIKACQGQIYHTLDKLGLGYSRVGATMVAWDRVQGSKLPGILTGFRAKEVGDMLPISTSELYKSEPNLRREADSAIWIPGETVVDPWLMPLSLAHHARLRCAQIWTDCELVSCRRDGYRSWTAVTNQRTLTCRAVINCAGLHGDSVDRLVGKQLFNIKPRKGQYIVYGKDKRGLVNSSILPVPTETTKGVIIFRSVYNNLIVGPTAEDVESRSIPQPYPAIKGRLLQHAIRTIPGLAGCEVIGEYVGVRPATQYKDYQINSDPVHGWLSVGGIRSTGLSGCLGIADYVCNLLIDDLHLEPTQGRSLRIEEVKFDIQPNRYQATSDGYQYNITHPITQFGFRQRSAL